MLNAKLYEANESRKALAICIHLAKVYDEGECYNEFKGKYIVNTMVCMGVVISLGFRDVHDGDVE